MSSNALTVPLQTLPAVTIDAAVPAIVPTKPTMPKGGLKLAQLERFAPTLARDLYDRFDFAKSVQSRGEPTLSVKKSYGLVTTGEFRQMLVVQKAFDFRDRLIGVVGASAATMAGGFGAAMALGGEGYALVGTIGLLATMITAMAAGAGWQSKASEVRREVDSIARAEAALERAKSNDTKLLR